MIGEAQDTLGKAATAEGDKQPHEEEPGQELDQLERENERRVEALQGMHIRDPIVRSYFICFSNKNSNYRE